jgi:hypothetical protein
MSAYTGIRFKTQVLDLLKDNPIGPLGQIDHLGNRTGIEIDHAAGHFRLSFRLANYAKYVSGMLPLTDLQQIWDALEQNKASLGQAWLACKALEPDYATRNIALTQQRHEAHTSALHAAREAAGASGLTRSEEASIWSKIKADWDPQFDALCNEIEAAYRQAEPGPASFNMQYSRYFDAHELRVDGLSGVTRAQEGAILSPSQAWLDDWRKFTATTATTRGKEMLIHALHAMSNECRRVGLADLTNPAVVRLPQQAIASLDGAGLTEALHFANVMAFRRAPFFTGDPVAAANAERLAPPQQQPWIEVEQLEEFLPASYQF